ncbi:hypothetical protein ABT391_26365 [Streptomyces jumonjinensis]
MVADGGVGGAELAVRVVEEALCDGVESGIDHSGHPGGEPQRHSAAGGVAGVDDGQLGDGVRKAEGGGQSDEDGPGRAGAGPAQPLVDPARAGGQFLVDGPQRDRGREPADAGGRRADGGGVPVLAVTRPSTD